jgi:hypothetical protein
MAFSLCDFTLLWNLCLRFFLNPVTSPCCPLDWDHQNADRARLLLGYGVESFRCPRQFLHERSDGVSLMLALGYSGVDSGVLGTEPVRPIDWFLCLWLAMFTTNVSWALFRAFLDSVLSPSRYYSSPRLPVFDFHS